MGSTRVTRRTGVWARGLQGGQGYGEHEDHRENRENRGMGTRVTGRTGVWALATSVAPIGMGSNHGTNRQWATT